MPMLILINIKEKECPSQTTVWDMDKECFFKNEKSNRLQVT